MADLIKKSEASKILGVSPQAINKWIKQGKVAATKIGGTWRLDGEEVRAMLTLKKAVKQ